MVTDSLTPRRLSMIRTRIRKSSKNDLVAVQVDGQEAEQGVAAGGDGDGDGQHVVDQQRTARDHAGIRAQGVGGHDVAAAAVGKLFDDMGIGVGDDKNGQGGGQGQEDGQVGMLAQGAEGFLRAVGRGGEAVGAQADPGQQRHQGELVENGRVLDVARRPDHCLANFFQKRRLFV